MNLAASAKAYWQSDEPSHAPSALVPRAAERGMLTAGWLGLAAGYMAVGGLCSPA